MAGLLAEGQHGMQQGLGAGLIGGMAEQVHDPRADSLLLARPCFRIFGAYHEERGDVSPSQGTVSLLH